MSYHVRNSCRLCGGSALDVVLQLESTPAANDFVLPDQISKPQEVFPLYLVQCMHCDHVQLPVVLSPQILFSNYVYVSGTSSKFVKHFENYALEMIQRFNLKPGDLVVDIGSNDGTLLRFFKNAGMRVVGVDPAQLISEHATLSGIETLCAFFDRLTANAILSKHGYASLVLANNVFAHADDLAEIAHGVRDLLHPDSGWFVFEVQYLVDMVENTLFDMVYHEHLSYHSVKPLMNFFSSLGMSLVDVLPVDTHGGSIRGTVAMRKGLEPSISTLRLLERERVFLLGDPFGDLKRRIGNAREQLNEVLSRVIGEVIGYGAPAKLTTLMYQFNIASNQIKFVVDDSQWKQGMLTPGKHIPVVPPSQLLARENNPEIIIIFAWNFADQIINKYPQFRGSYVVPLPKLKRY